MSGVSNATTIYGVIYHVFQYKSLYGDMIRAIDKARTSRSQGKCFCITFRNPLTGAQTILSATRIIQIYDNFNSVVWTSAEEQIAGLVLRYESFFRLVLGSYYRAEGARNKLNTYCQTFNVPALLFPSVPADSRQATLKGNQIILLMYASLGNTGIPAIVANGGPSACY